MFEAVLSTLAQVSLPLSLPVAAGALLARLKKLETKHLLTIVLYVLSPAIIFHTLSTAEVTWNDAGSSLLFSILDLALLWFAAQVASGLFRLPAPEGAGLTLVATLTNSVNYGLPLILLAFGQLGLGKASVYVVIQMIFVNTFGVFFAARSLFSGLAAIKAVFSLPSVYAAIFALALRLGGLALPAELMKGISMLSQAYSPLVLILLGAQMAGVRTERADRAMRSAFGAGLVLRMIAAPLLAYAILSLLGIGGILRSVLFIEASMPVAVNSVILAEKFGAAPKFVTRCILWTTLASFVVLPVLIAFAKTF
jgi:predicted permease